MIIEVKHKPIEYHLNEYNEFECLHDDYWQEEEMSGMSGTPENIIEHYDILRTCKDCEAWKWIDDTQWKGEDEEELSCCNDVITDDGFCPTCWEHCK